MAADRPRFRVLGPLEVADPSTGDPLDLGGPKQRAVLAMLLLARGQVVPLTRLVEGLWGDAPPASAQGTLQAYVSNLRRVLEPDRTKPTVLVTQAPGYRLDVPVDDVDAAVFARLVDEGRAALGAARADDAVSSLAAAMALWRGPLLGELGGERFVEADAGRFEELRLQGLESWAEALLATGRHVEVAAELAGAVAENPLRPRLRGHLMLALYRSGRQAEALRAYSEGRTVLRRELGAEPEPELQELEDRILLQDPALDWRPPMASPALASPQSGALEGGAGGGVLVGRDAELAAVDGALVSAASGAGGVVLVTGEAGIGKTRLAEAVGARAAARGAVVAWGRSFESEGAPAFWPWVEVLRHAFASEVAEPGALLRDVGADAGLLVRLLPELASVAPAAPDASEAGDEALRFSLYGAVSRALAAVASRRPVVVVLDDAHWADAASLRLLRFLAPNLPTMAVLVVVTFRDDEVDGELADALAALARQESVTRLELGGLSEGDIGRLLADALAETPADPVVRDIAERSAGNPFFVGELARLLAGPSSPAAGDVPPGVRDVIRRRIDRLPEGADRLLAAAAVTGREFDLAVAAEVAELDADDDATLDLVDAAVSARLLVEGSRIGRYRFTHALVQDALRSGLSGRRRARMHDRIARVLASWPRSARAEDLAELAFHALEGADVGDAAAALGHALEAAAASLAALSFEQAASLCALGLAVMDRTGAGDDGCRFVLQHDLGVARRRLGDVEGAREALADALATARVLDDAERFATAALAFGGGAWWGWWSDVGFADAEAVAAFEEALDRLGPSPSPLRAEVLGRLAVELHFDDASAARRDDLSAEALTMARRLADRRALVHALAARHVAVWRAGNGGERRVLADELVATARAARMVEPEAFGHHFLMLAALERGDAAAAQAQLEEGERLVRSLPLPHLTAQIAWSRSMFAAMAGRFDDAEVLQNEALASTARWSEPEAFRTWSAQLAALRWDQGRGAELAEPLRRLVHGEAVAANWKTGLALLLADAGETDEAARWFDDVAAEGFSDVPADLGRLFNLAVRALTAMLLVDAERAAQLLPLVEPHLGDHVVQATRLVYAGPVSFLVGGLRVVVGDLDSGISMLERAVADAERIGSPPFVARAKLGLARAHHARGDRGDDVVAGALAAEAGTLARTLGMARVAARAASAAGGGP